MEADTTEAYQILEQMFDLIAHNTQRPPRACFNQLVRYLADCVRLHPLPQEEHSIGDRLWPHTMPFLEAFYADPRDYLGTLFTEKECSNDVLGQIITPRPIVTFINEATIGQLGTDDDAGADEWQLVLDPCTGTGRFLFEAARQFPHRKLVFYGVELDIDLYRAALVNMRLMAWHRPHYILRANALVVDLQPTSPNWQYANQWDPPNWETTMMMESGETWAAWCEAHDHDVAEAPTPSRDVDGPDTDEPLQYRLL